jgi:hypothetical protein
VLITEDGLSTGDTYTLILLSAVKTSLEIIDKNEEQKSTPNDLAIFTPLYQSIAKVLWPRTSSNNIRVDRELELRSFRTISLLQVVPFSMAEFRAVRDEELLIFSLFSLKPHQVLDVWNK